MPSIVPPAADFISVLEALYHPEPNMTRWAGEVLTMIGSVVAVSPGQGIMVVANENRYETTPIVLADVRNFMRKNGNDELGLPTGDIFRATFYPAVTHGEIESALTVQTNQEGTRQGFRGYWALTGTRDVLRIFAYPQPGLVVVLWMLFDRNVALSRFERYVLHRVAGHLDSALRLRYRPDLAVAAVLSPDGRFLDLDDASIEGAQRERITERVLTLDRTRLRDRRKTPDALDDWQALIAGRYSVVLRDDNDGKRYYLLVRNAAITEPHARFSMREIDVLRLAARGFTGKGITYVLGLAPVPCRQRWRAQQQRLVFGRDTRSSKSRRPCSGCVRPRFPLRP